MLEQSASGEDADDRAYMSLSCHCSLNCMDRNYYFDYNHDDSCFDYCCIDYSRRRRHVDGPTVAGGVAVELVDLTTNFLAAK